MMCDLCDMDAIGTADTGLNLCADCMNAHHREHPPTHEEAQSEIDYYEGHLYPQRRIGIMIGVDTCTLPELQAEIARMLGYADVIVSEDGTKGLGCEPGATSHPCSRKPLPEWGEDPAVTMELLLHSAQYAVFILDQQEVVGDLWEMKAETLDGRTVLAGGMGRTGCEAIARACAKVLVYSWKK